MSCLKVDSRLTYYNAKIQLWEYLKERVNRAQALRDIKRDAVTSPEALRAYTEEFRHYFLKQIGGLPEAQGLPGSECFGEIQEDGFCIQKWMLETRPGVRATSNLYVPEGATKNTPAVLFLCGHSTNAKAEPRYQILARMLVARGLIVLVLDPTGQGERMGYYDNASGKFTVRPGTGEHEYCGFQCLLQGHNLSRYMLHDAIRAVDFLSAHPLVDPSRIGVTGSSGGGTQTTLMLLVEPRLAAAAPATFVTSRRAIFDSGYGQDAEQIWPGFSAAGYDHADLLMAFAPKPLCVLSVQYDFFPIEGTRETLNKAKRFWEMHGCENLFQPVEDVSVHRYTDKLGHAACDFFVKSFQLEEKSLKENLIPLPVEQLWVTKTGQVLGDFSDVKTIFDENKEAFAQTKKDIPQAAEFLKKAVFAAREPVDLNLRITQEFLAGDISACSGFWWSQAGLLNSGMLLRSIDAKEVKTPVTIALWEDGSEKMDAHDSWIRQEIRKGRSVLVLNVTGMGPLEPFPFNSETDPKTYHGSFYRVCDDLSTLGDSFAALRTYDVLRSLETLKKWQFLDDSDVQLYLHGPYGIYGALASVLDNRLNRSQWNAPLVPYREMLQSRYYNDRDVKSFIIPGLIQFADWTDLAEDVITNY